MGFLSTSTANGFGNASCILSALLCLQNTSGIICKAVFILCPYLIFFCDVSSQDETRMVMSSCGSASKLHAGPKQEFTAAVDISSLLLNPCRPAPETKIQQGPAAERDCVKSSLKYKHYSPLNSQSPKHSNLETQNYFPILLIKTFHVWPHLPLCATVPLI